MSKSKTRNEKASAAATGLITACTEDDGTVPIKVVIHAIANVVVGVSVTSGTPPWALLMTIAALLKGFGIDLGEEEEAGDD